MEVRVIRCFIASPSDTQTERDIVDEVFDEINRSLGYSLGFRLESIKWEKDSSPTFGEDGQDVINKQLLLDYDVFIGIMYSKFGCATPRAGSGTEEEFNQAYRAYNEGKDIEIKMYFNIQASKLNEIDAEQLLKVQRFQDKVSKLGGLYNQYSGTEEFRKNFQQHIQKFLLEKYNTLTKEIDGQSQKRLADAIKSAAVSEILEDKLLEALTSFGEGPNVWLEPILSKKSDIHETSENNYENRIDINSIISKPYSLIIKSPPQFGLTCLSRHLILESWKQGNTWIYLDFKKLNKTNVISTINRKLALLDRKIEDICVF